LGWLSASLGALYALMVGVPVLGSLLAPIRQRRTPERWIDFGAIADLPLGEPRQLTAVSEERDGWYDQQVQRAIWVVRTDAETCTVFHPRCTHLGCAYHWEGEKREFVCPCHGGRYTMAGHVLGGPPPRALDTMGNRVKAGQLLVRFL
jgi:menaquinol-cytochrome c reductase iron-sulfur subunit